MNTSNGGRLSNINGEVYYSPNSQVEILHTPPHNQDHGVDHNPFLRNSRFNHFHRPGYWSRPYGWIAFVPHHPNFSSRPFDRLFRLPRAVKDPKGWCMPKHVADAWLELENSLRGLISHLCNHFEIPAVAPFPPSGHGFLKFHPTRDAAHSSIEASRDWFGLWQGLLSFCLACAHSNHSQRLAWRQEAGLDPSVCPSWLEYLARQGYDQTWLEGFMTSSVYMFTPSVIRTGIFIDVIEPLDRFLPTLDWYIEHGIPVWYRCPSPGTTPHRYITHTPTDDDFKAFLNVGRGEPSTPSGPTPSSTSHSISEEHAGSARHVTAPEEPSASIGDVVAPQRKLPSPDNRGDQAGQRAKQIGDYRASQQASFDALQLTSTDREKKCWASRLRQPPTRKCKVLIWAPDPQNPGVLKKAKGEPDDLWDFTDNQKWYDPVQDAWHCCVDLAPNEMTDEDHHLMEDLYGSNYVADLSLAVPPHPEATPLQTPEVVHDSTNPLPASAQSGAMESHETQWDDRLDQFLPPSRYEEDQVGEQFIQTLSKFYGFLPPLPAPLGNASPPASKAERVWALRMVGMHPSISHGAPFFESSMFTFVMAFLQGLCAKGAKPPVDAWDMSEVSREPIPRSGPLPPLHVIPGNPPLFVLKLTQVKSWTLAVTTAADAVLVLRLIHLPVENIVLELVRKGIRFNTLLPERLHRPITTQSPSPARIPVRLPGYVFSNQDYDSYQQSRNILLAEGRLRAALTRGGIIWRMAAAFLTPSDALSGPSTSASMVRNDRDGVVYVDDALTPVEVQLLCGAYLCCSESADDKGTIRSWWPLPEVFDISGENYGRWTSYRENHYIARHKEIVEGKAQPLTGREWRDRMRGRSDLRRLHINCENNCREFLESKFPGAGIPPPTTAASQA
ncbi:hypothetical protein BKA70DRAFT_1440788 [Coprinopsis sp. MPI-PUGE-AT-0042]|nr:hypothetical protein BKA70DRAFT_1440788 [Coprinopsis sp. MPI-PUGE-AT-0042]